jgi:hypothetical protein
MPGLAAVGPAQLTALEAQVAAIRGLSFLHPVPCQEISREEVIQNLKGEIDRETNFVEYAAFLKAFGFVADDFNVRDAMQGLYGEQVGGYYDPRTGRFFIVAGGGLPADAQAEAAGLGISMEDITVSHELTHALQDQHFNLLRIESSVDQGTEDQKLAVSSLFEGDATAVMIEQPFKKMGIDTSLLAGMGGLSSMMEENAVGQGGQFPNFEKAPLYFKRAMMFPYVQGFAMISSLRQRGGWEAVNQKYAHLPASTEEVLEGGLTLPPSPPLQFEPLAGWSAVTHGTLGAYLFGVWCERFVPEHPPADHAEHWRADRYEVLTQGHQRMLRWASRWEDEQAASTAWEALKTGFATRHPGLSWRPDGVNRLRWTAPNGSCTELVRQAAQVEVVDGAPADAIEGALRLQRLP